MQGYSWKFMLMGSILTPPLEKVFHTSYNYEVQKLRKSPHWQAVDPVQV